MRSTLLLGAALAGMVGWSALTVDTVGKQGADPGGDGFACTVGRILDSDTFDCVDGPRIRLGGVNGRERDGSCRRAAPCVDMPADAATAELVRLAAGETLRCERNGSDPYGRVSAFCRRRSDGVDLSCAMLEAGAVARWDRYWNGHRC